MNIHLSMPPLSPSPSISEELSKEEESPKGKEKEEAQAPGGSASAEASAADETLVQSQVEDQLELPEEATSHKAGEAGLQKMAAEKAKFENIVKTGNAELKARREAAAVANAVVGNPRLQLIGDRGMMFGSTLTILAGASIGVTAVSGGSIVAIGALSAAAGVCLIGTIGFGILRYTN